MGELGPFTVDDVAPLFSCYGNPAVRYEKARLRLNKLVERGSLIEIGRVQLKEFGGPVQKVFACPSLPIKKHWITHDTMLWKYLRTLENAKRIVAGFDCDRETREDAAVEFSNGKRAKVEMDCDQESLAFLEKRFDVLAKKVLGDGQSEFILFITVSAARMERVKARAAKHPIGEAILFGLWHDLVKSQEHCWQGFNGRSARLYPVGG